MTSGEPDFTKRMVGKLDHWWIKGVELKDPTESACLPISIEHIVRISHEQILGTALKTPTFAQCVPTSIENDALAYDTVNDRFKVDIEAMSVGTLITDITDDWTRQLGLVDLSRVLGAALSHSNPVIVRLTNGTAFIDPKDIRALTSSDIVTVYGSQTQALLQRATTYDSLVQLRHEGVEINPQTIRALTSTDIITAYGSLDALQQRATTKELIVQIQHQGVEKDPTQIRALTNSDVVTVEQATPASLTATVTQAAKDRTITDVSHDGTAVDLSHTFAAAGSWEAHSVTADKKVRVLFISLELSADVALGYRFTNTGTIYYLRTTAGAYVSNLVFCTNIGAVDADLFIYASAACVIKGYAMIEEV